MKSIFIFLTLSLSLFAQSKTTCYSVEVFKEPYTKELSKHIDTMNFDSSCLKMKLKNNLAVRCGCFKSKEAFEPALIKFQKKYPQAKKTVTYAYRFKNLQKVVQKKKLVVKPKVEKKCYTVEILQVRNTKENKKALLKNKKENCKMLEHTKYLSYSCGCYADKRGVIGAYKKLKEKYDYAHIEYIKMKEFYPPKEKLSISKVLDSIDEGNKTSILKVLQERDGNTSNVKPLDWIDVEELNAVKVNN